MNAKSMATIILPISGKIFLAVALAISFAIGCASAYSEKELESIKKLRAGVGAKLTHDYMKTDEYLMRWLIAKKMDAKQAQEMLETALKWRKDNKIDGLLIEDFGAFEKQYPVRRFGFDKGGRPVLGVHFGNWVPRKAATNGQVDQLVRYMIKAILEEGRVAAEEQSKKDGKQNSRFTVLIDMGGYNLKEHACLQCFSLYTKFVQLYESNYPETFYKVLILNSPTIFETILEIIKPLMSPASKRDFTIHGVRKADWIPAVQKYIDADQIPPQYGGNKKFAG